MSILKENRMCPLCNKNRGIHFTTYNYCDVLKCPDCTMIYINLPEKLALIHNVYQEDVLLHYYHNEPKYTIAYYDNLIQGINKYLKKTASILEFGCGSGMLMRRARRFGNKIKGIDYSPYAAKAKELFGLDIDIMDINNCSPIGEKYDCVISHATYEHLFNPVQITQKLQKYLRTGGLLILSGIPNSAHFRIKYLKDFSSNDPLEHINYFDKKTIKALLTNSDIKPVLIKTYGFDIWRYIEYFDKIKNNNIESPTKKMINKTEERMHSLESKDPNKLCRFLSKLYSAPGVSILGKSLEAWGVKE